MIEYNKMHLILSSVAAALTIVTRTNAVESTNKRILSMHG